MSTLAANTCFRHILDMHPNRANHNNSCYLHVVFHILKCIRHEYIFYDQDKKRPTQDYMFALLRHKLTSVCNLRAHDIGQQQDVTSILMCILFNDDKYNIHLNSFYDYITYNDDGAFEPDNLCGDLQLVCIVFYRAIRDGGHFTCMVIHEDCQVCLYLDDTANYVDVVFDLAFYIRMLLNDYNYYVYSIVRRVEPCRTRGPWNVALSAALCQSLFSSEPIADKKCMRIRNQQWPLVNKYLHAQQSILTRQHNHRGQLHITHGSEPPPQAV